jgi:D-alanyl-D-alanine carboxypeptidase (penicillin-binding protein 5/6)
MNAKARELGLRDTHFANPHGLDQPGHLSSARDAVRLVRAALRSPFLRASFALRSTTISPGRTLVSTDDLLDRFPQFLGGKTGHTAGAGWSQVGAARANGVVVYAAVLGEPSRERRSRDLEALLRWGLGRYRQVTVVDSRRAYAEVATAYGRPPARLLAARSVVLPVRVDRPLVERIVAPTRIVLPVTAGQRLGEVRVYDRSRLLATVPLVAASGIEEPGLLGKAGWYARRTLHHLAGLVS